MNLRPRTAFVWLTAWGFIPLVQHVPTLDENGNHIAGPKTTRWDVSTIPLVRFPSVERRRHALLDRHFTLMDMWSALKATRTPKLESFACDAETRDFLENWTVW